MSLFNNSNYSDNTARCLDKGEQFARERNDSYFMVEHLLYGMLFDEEVKAIISYVDAHAESLQETIREFIDSEQMMKKLRAAGPERPLVPSPAVNAALEAAKVYANQYGNDKIEPLHVLMGMTDLEESKAVEKMFEIGLSRSYLLRALSVPANERAALLRKKAEATTADEEISSNNGGKNPLDQFAVNLTEKAQQGKLNSLVGREREVNRIVQTLSRRLKNNPLLVGEPGVGKTAIIEGLAQRIVSRQVPEVLWGSKIYSLDVASLVAGTKYRGDFEERMKKLLKQVEKDPSIIMFIDEIHTIVGAGGSSGSAMDASNLLKPALSNGTLRLIGSTTHTECRTIFEKDQALNRRFQKLEVKEPSVDEAIDILMGSKSSFEKHHELQYTNAAIRAAVELSVRYMPDRLLPDKAIDILDEAGASQRIVNASARVEIIDVEQVEATVGEITGVPVQKMNNSEKDSLKSLSYKLKEQIYGQDEAIKTLVNAIKLNRSGLREGRRPVGSFLFMGPTGVGKTEVCNQLSHLMGMKLLRFDMSEYTESHSVSRLVGAPPGYVGHDNGGLLTEAVNKSPYSIVLLDEMEKANRDIYNLLLQVMDNGVLTDSHGRSVDFTNVILIMTSNVGAAHAARSSIGFTKQDNQSDSREAFKKTFTPEFRNRLDSVVEFAALGTNEIIRVVEKNLKSLRLSLGKRGLMLNVSKEAEEWLAKNGFEESMGARPMARLIDKKIKQPLADILLFDDIDAGATIDVSLSEDELKVVYKNHQKNDKKHEMVLE